MAQKEHYTITQQLDNKAIDSVKFIKTTKPDGMGGYMDVNNINDTNYQNIDIQEKDIEEMEVHSLVQSD